MECTTTPPSGAATTREVNDRRPPGEAPPPALKVRREDGPGIDEAEQDFDENGIPYL